LALPIILLYEISIWMAKLVERERAKREALLEQELKAPST
jgi:Sec-independent protein secretion pathway component TatC